MAQWGEAVFRELGTERLDELVAAGHRRRDVFPHRTLFLPRPGPDGYRLAKAMLGVTDPAAMRELVLYATGRSLDGLPGEVFFDDEVVWHRQQLGLPGQIATADVVLGRDELWSMAHVADVVQRIGRRRALKTQVEKRFSGWNDLVLNALLALAAELGLARVHTPVADFQRRHTDPARNPEPELFDRVYDRAVQRLYRTERDGRWWTIDVAANRDRLVVPDRRTERLVRPKTICVSHDVEAGLGHAEVDPAFARQADREWPGPVERMLAVETAAGVRTTYNVVGVLMADVRAEIERGGHAVAFHSYDHRVGRFRLPRALRARTGFDQLARCRRLDYRLKGYRPPRSWITRDLRDEQLLFHNFEWLSSSPESLGLDAPALSHGVVRLPVHLDDAPLFRRLVDLDGWVGQALAIAAARDVSVITTHDCYGSLWLDRYPDLLRRLGELGELRTLDDVAADLTLTASL